MSVPDLVVQVALQGGLDSLHADPNQVRLFLRDLAEVNSAVYQQALGFFTTAPISVILGWPEEAPPATLAVVALTLGPDTETTPPIGGDIDEESEVIGGVTAAITEYEGSEFSAQVNCTVYSANQSACIWTAAAVRWALLAQRPALEETVGFYEQRLSLADLGPDSRFSSAYVFRRNVGLNFKYAELTETVYTRFLKTVNIYEIDNRSPGNFYLDPNP